VSRVWGAHLRVFIEEARCLPVPGKARHLRAAQAGHPHAAHAFGRRVHSRGCLRGRLRPSPALRATAAVGRPRRGAGGWRAARRRLPQATPVFWRRRAAVQERGRQAARPRRRTQRRRVATLGRVAAPGLAIQHHGARARADGATRVARRDGRAARRREGAAHARRRQGAQGRRRLTGGATEGRWRQRAGPAPWTCDMSEHQGYCNNAKSKRLNRTAGSKSQQVSSPEAGWTHPWGWPAAVWRRADAPPAVVRQRGWHAGAVATQRRWRRAPAARWRQAVQVRRGAARRRHAPAQRRRAPWWG
jgi:hypothetical protein